VSFFCAINIEIIRYFELINYCNNTIMPNKRRVLKLNVDSNKLEIYSKPEDKIIKESDHETESTELTSDVDSDYSVLFNETTDEESSKIEKPCVSVISTETQTDKSRIQCRSIKTQTIESCLRKKKHRKKVFRLPKIFPEHQNVINNIIGCENLLIYHYKNPKGVYINYVKRILKSCLGFSAEKTEKLLETICEESECFIVQDYVKYMIVNRRKVKQILSKKIPQTSTKVCL